MEITRGKNRVYGGCSRNSQWHFLSFLTVLFATCGLALSWRMITLSTSTLLFWFQRVMQYPRLIASNNAIGEVVTLLGISYQMIQRIIRLPFITSCNCLRTHRHETFLYPKLSWMMLKALPKEISSSCAMSLIRTRRSAFTIAPMRAVLYQSSIHAVSPHAHCHSGFHGHFRTQNTTISHFSKQDTFPHMLAAFPCGSRWAFVPYSIENGWHFVARMPWTC